MTITEQYDQDEKLESLYLRESFLEFAILNPNQVEFAESNKAKLANVRTEISKMLNLISK